MMVGGRQVRARRAISASHAKPSVSGMFAVEQHEAERLGRRRQRAASASSASRPLATAVGLHAPARNLLMQNAPVDRVVVDDEHGQRRQRHRSRAGRRQRPMCRSDAVKWNVLPAPGSLSTQMRPPIILHELRGDRQARAPCRRTAASSSRRPG